MDWFDEEMNTDVTAESTTYESWYKQEDQLDHSSMSCLLPCLVLERRDSVEGEAKRIRKQSDDDEDADDDDDPVDDDEDDDDDDTVDGNNNKKKDYSDSEYKERYTATLLDH